MATAVAAEEETAIANLPVVEAEQLERSKTLIAALETSKAELRKVGAMAACASIANEIRKEVRRQRQLCTESPAVAAALARRQDQEDAERWRERRRVQDANKQMVALKDIRQQAEHAAEQVRKRKAQFSELENRMESRQLVKRFTPDVLGQGKPQWRRHGWAEAAPIRPLCHAEERLAVVQGSMG